MGPGLLEIFLMVFGIVAEVLVRRKETNDETEYTGESEKTNNTKDYW